MAKRILALVIVLSLAFSLGCSGLPRPGTSNSSLGSFEVVRKAQLGTKWQMQQLNVQVGSSDLTILMKLADGDKVDGYFYTEKGDNVSFRIAGNSAVYDSVPQGAASVTGGVSSDRFTFSATQAQGSTYSLTFRSASGDKSQKTVAVFLEVVYPVTASIFIPLESK